MDDFIETPAIGEILSEEFMKPLGISVRCLTNEIGVSSSRIQDILHGKRRVTADTSIRLARFFGVSDGYFLRLQSDIDIRNTRTKINDQLQEIKAYA